MGVWTVYGELWKIYGCALRKWLDVAQKRRVPSTSLAGLLKTIFQPVSWPYTKREWAYTKHAFAKEMAVTLNSLVFVVGNISRKVNFLRDVSEVSDDCYIPRFSCRLLSHSCSHGNWPIRTDQHCSPQIRPNSTAASGNMTGSTLLCQCYSRLDRILL